MANVGSFTIEAGVSFFLFIEVEMAIPLQLSTKIVLSGPYNLRPVVNAINKGLAGVKANVNISINKSTTGGIQGVNNVLKSLNSTLAQVATNANSVKVAIQGIASAFSSVNTTSRATNNQINGITKAVNNLSKGSKEAKTDMELFGREAGLAVKRAGAFAIATGAIFGLVRSVKAGITSAIEFERGMVKLSQVTRLSVGGLKSLNDEIDRLSVGLGVSSDDLLDVSKILAQAGLSMRDVRTALEAVAKSTLAPSFDDITNTTEGLIAIMGQFKDEMTGTGIVAKDFEKVLGSINAVSAAFAVEADDIVAAVRRTGGVFASASSGIGKPIDQLNELIAVFTSVRSNTRESAETIATGLRTIFTRLQRPQTIDFLRQFGVELTDLNGKFIGPFRAIKQLSEALQELSPRDLRFALITEELGGIRQVGKLIPAIREFGTAQEALGVAVRGQTSLSEDAAIAQQSLGNQFDKTRESFLKLIRDLTQTDSFQLIARFALATANGFVRLADSVKELIPLLGVLLAARTLRGIHEFSTGFIGTFRGGSGFGRGRKGFAGGGLVPGVGNHDNFPAMLTPGEFVIRKAAVRQLGVDRLDQINRKYNGSGSVDPLTDEEILDKFKRFKIDVRQDYNRAITKGIPAKIDFLKSLGPVAFQQIQNKRQGLSVDAKTTNEAKRAARQSKEYKTLILNGSTNSFGSAVLNPIDREDSPQKSYTITDLPPSIKKLGYTALAGHIPTYYVDSKKREKLDPILENGVNGIIKHGTESLSNNQVKLTSTQIEAIKKRLQINSLKGILFEGVLAGFGNVFGNKSGGAGGTFDFVGKEVIGLQGLWSDAGQLPKNLEAKITDDSKSRNDVLRKAVRAGLIQGKTLTLTKGDLDAQRYASGGNVDTVPALLTPGEYVINKRAASRIGRAALEKLNKGEVQAFQHGGIVNPQGLATGIDQAFRLSDAERQLKAAFGTLARDGAGLRIGIDAYKKALNDTKGTLVDLQEEYKKGAITQAQFNAGLQQRKVDALKIARKTIRGHNAGIAPPGLEALFEDAGFGGSGGGGGGGNPPTGTEVSAGRPRRSRGFGKSKIDPALLAGKIQGAGFGLLGAAALAQSFLPEPTSARSAALTGGLSGVSAGAGIGLQLGALGGPIGAGIGAAAGGTIGAVQGTFQSFYEFERSQSLKKMEAGITATTAAFEALRNNTGSIVDVMKNIDSTANFGKKADIATINKDQFSIGNLVDKGAIVPGLGSLGRTEDVRRFATSLFTGKTVSDIKESESFTSLTSSIENRKNLGLQLSPEFKKEFLTGRIDKNNLNLNSGAKAAIAAADPVILEKALGRVSRENTTKDLSIEQQQVRLNKILEGEFNRTLVPGLEKSKAKLDATSAAQEELAANMSRAKREVDLFANDLSKSSEILNRTNTVFAQFESTSSAALGRAMGGTNVSAIVGRNAFENAQTSSIDDFKNAFGVISRFTGGGSEIAGLQNTTIEVKKLIDAMPKILDDALTGPDVGIQNKVTGINEALSRFNVPEQIKNEVAEKLKKLTQGGEGEGKTGEQIRNELQNILTEIVPLGEKVIAQTANIYSKVIEAQNRYADALSKFSSAQRQVDEKRFAAQQETQESFIRIGERETGRVNVGARFGLQDAAVGRLTGGVSNIGDISRQSLAIQKALSDLDKRLAGSGGSKADIEKRDSLVNALDDNKKALEILSKNTIKLSAVQEKIQEIENRKQTGTSFAERIATGGPEEVMKINRGIMAVARFREGGLAAVGGGRGREDLGEGLSVVRSLMPELAKEIDEKLRLEVFGGIGGELDKKFGKGLAGEEGIAKAEEAKLLKEAAAASEALHALASADMAGLWENAARAQIDAANAVREAAGTIGFRGPRGPGRAGGGFVAGAGTSTSDSIPTRLSNGEFVMKADAVRRYGVGFMQRINSGTAPRRGFAEGGLATGAGITISGEALGALNNFSAVASRLSQTIENFRIPENITMTGTHEVRVIINGAEALTNLLNGPLGNYVEGRIHAALQKHLPAQQRHEGIG
jgi:TP901 family phage tail tape measure protein